MSCIQTDMDMKNLSNTTGLQKVKVQSQHWSGETEENYENWSKFETEVQKNLYMKQQKLNYIVWYKAVQAKRTNVGNTTKIVWLVLCIRMHVFTTL
jgi:hypothetical protein